LNVLKKIMLFSLVLLILVSILGCQDTITSTVTTDEFTTLDTIQIIDSVSTDKSMYSPLEEIIVTVNLYNLELVNEEGKVEIDLYYLDEFMTSVESEMIQLNSYSTDSINLSLTAPNSDFTGYILYAKFIQSNQVTDKLVSAVDVSSDWSKFPRYGYLTDYSDLTDEEIQSVIQELSLYHINGLQFYDWQNTHQDPLPLNTNGNPLSTWLEISNRTVYFDTLSAYIDTAHDYNMMAMNYNLLYGSYDGASGVDLSWGLYQDSTAETIDSHSLPDTWQTSKILLMNPNNALWQNYLFSNEQIVFDHLNFDGWHIDQLGNRGTLYDIEGNTVDMLSAYTSFINNAKETLDISLVFNAVDGYGQDVFATNNNLDFLYQEVWGTSSYSGLKSVIDSAFTKSSFNDAIVLAAYMNYGSRDSAGYFNTPAVLLTNATIFASGGSHLELGDSGMLSSEYFPYDKLQMSSVLKERLIDYYNFLVAYENLLRDDVRNTTVDIELDGYTTSSYGTSDTIWTFAKTKDDQTIIHLINLLDNTNNWRDDFKTKIEPEQLNNIVVRLYMDDVSSVHLASPDIDGGSYQSIDFTSVIDCGGNYIEFTLPSLEYWDMIVIN